MAVRPARPAAAAALAVAGLAALVGLTGCVPTSPAKTPTPTSSSTASPTTSATPAAAEFVPDGSASDNKAFFDSTNETLFASNGSANGRAIIDSLVAAGFDKTAMQVTPDVTSVGGAVDSILFSVKIGDSCLLGQHGGGGYSSAVEKALTNGTCLVGKTRAIDW